MSSPLTTPVKNVIHKMGRRYVQRINESERAHHKPTRTNERPIEYAFVFNALNLFQPKRVLDVGTGTTALPSMIATCGFEIDAIDNVTDYWPEGMMNRHYPVEDRDICDPKIAGSMKVRYDLITCISVIEHIVDHVQAMRNMRSLLNPGGRIVVTTPFSEARGVPNVYEIEGSYGAGAPYICRQSTRSDLEAWLSCGLTVEIDDRWELFESEVWSVGKLVRPPKKVEQSSRHQLGCFVLGLQQQ